MNISILENSTDLAANNNANGRRCLSTKGLAEFLSVDPATVMLMRDNGTGPEFIQAVPRGKILYPLASVVAWVDRQPKFKSSIEARIHHKEAC